MKITAFDGSPRKNGNSTAILRSFTDRAEELGADLTVYRTSELDLKECRGCLMCNVLKKCAIRNDCWNGLADEISASDVLVFATPIYFHHTVSSMKRLLDRFRSFINVRITEEGIIHTPHNPWNKKIFLFTAHGSSSVEDALPLVDLFDFMKETLGEKNSLKCINGTRLAMAGQVTSDKTRLSEIYTKLGLPQHLVEDDYKKNIGLLKTAEEFAENIFSG